MRAIERAVARLPTNHRIVRGDARHMNLAPGSVHLVVTSPPYWTLKEYRDHPAQLGHVANYVNFLAALDDV